MKGYKLTNRKIIDAKPDKKGFIEALLNRLPEDEKQDLNTSSFSFFDYTIETAGLQLLSSCWKVQWSE